MRTIAIIIVLTSCLTTVSKGQSNEINTLLRNYYAITSGMISGNQVAIRESAIQLKEGIQDFPLTSLSTAGLKVWNKQAKKMSAALETITGSNQPEDQKEQLDKLSNAFFTILEALPPLDEPVYLMYCPMKKANWLSKSEKIKNPFYGTDMLTCGQVVQILN